MDIINDNIAPSTEKSPSPSPTSPISSNSPSPLPFPSNSTQPSNPQNQEPSHDPATYRQIFQPVPPSKRAASAVIDTNSTSQTVTIVIWYFI